MSSQMYMKIDGVSGDSKSYQHKGWCEVMSWNWGMTSNRKTVNGVDGDKTNLNEISVIKSIGGDSAGIRSLFAQGKMIPSVEFCIIPVVAKRGIQTKYVDISMEDVVIKSIVTGGGIEDSFFKEHITLLFDRINFEYSNDPVRSVEGADSETVDNNFRWNVSASTEWKQPA